MRIAKANVVFPLMACCVAFQVSGARADEAFVCDAGTVVYVKPGELEAMKRSDPCIAGYFGLTVESKATPVIGAPAKQDRSAAPKEAAPALAPALKRLSEPEADKSAANEQGSPTRLAASSPKPVVPAKPVAAADTDFRNVHVLNGAPGESSWYRHEK